MIEVKMEHPVSEMSFGTPITKLQLARLKRSIIAGSDESRVKLFFENEKTAFLAPVTTEDAFNLVKNQSQSASWMASNCAGAFLLGEAGVLDNKRATTWAGGEKDLAASYPKIKVQFDNNVVIDDKVITSNGGPVSYQAAFELLAKLSSQKFANEISESIQYNRLKNAFK
jgi:transcriptional regulator GlxA family with amidase domain